MEYGATIESGAKDWQIFQRSADNTASITLAGHCNCVRLSQELPLQFDHVNDRPVTVVKARVAMEATGEDVCPWTPCQIDGTRWQITFPHVPAGGPYRLETTMEYQGWDGLSCTRGDMVHFVGVGDVFVIAGQSNAAGRAKGPVEDSPELGVHVLRSSGTWALASHPLGETTGAKHVGHYENHNPGHSPWLHFAKRLRRELGIPIGLVPCAYGGAPLRWWNLAENGALTENMLAMLAEYQLHPKAVLWVQGEAEGFEQSAETYLPRFRQTVDAIREKLHQPELPFFTVQISRCMIETTEALDRQWGQMREAQRQAAHSIPGVSVVPSTDVAMYDFIHDSAQGNLVIGERCARAALTELYGKSYDWRAPEPVSATRVDDRTVRVCFAPIRNWLNPYEVTAQNLPFDAEDSEGLVSPASYTTEPDGLVITFARALGGHARLHGMWRMNPGNAIPCDCMRLPVLSFYDFPITEG